MAQRARRFRKAISLFLNRLPNNPPLPFTTPSFTRWRMKRSDSITISRLHGIFSGFCFRRKQNPLNIPCNLEIVIESLLFIRHRVNYGVVKGKGGLFGNRFKNNEIALRKRRAHWAIGNGEDTELLFSVGKRCRHHGGSPKSTVT